MAFMCQKDSFLKELTTGVRSCAPAVLHTETNGKKKKIEGFEVILEDTVLFPEGGGQPDDFGTINGLSVLRVTRKGGDAVHFVESPLEVGVSVDLRVDWARRFDHMQQHSGQHLVTALADSMYGFKTTSWDLGKQRSSIELDTPSVSAEQLRDLELAVNTKIREHVPVEVHVYEADDPELAQFRSRGLPDDHVGPVRIIDIKAVDANMCCGTHVSNLSQLQAIKIFGAEKGKKNKTNILFLAGSRVLQYCERSYANERALNALVKVGPEEQVEAVDRLQKQAKLLQKSNTILLRDLAVLTAKSCREEASRSGMFSMHRKEGDNEFMNIIANELSSEGVLVFLSVGDEKAAGLFLVAGPQQAVQELGPKVAEVLEGKGAGKGPKFQGKANKMSRRAEAEVLVRDYVAAQRPPEA
ncbi:alanyl-tRNA editing protein Aarsd1 [Lampetra fluviatilis]